MLTCVPHIHPVHLVVAATRQPLAGHVIQVAPAQQYKQRQHMLLPQEGWQSTGSQCLRPQAPCAWPVLPTRKHHRHGVGYRKLCNKPRVSAADAALVHTGDQEQQRGQVQQQLRTPVVVELCLLPGVLAVTAAAQQNSTLSSRPACICLKIVSYSRPLLCRVCECLRHMAVHLAMLLARLGCCLCCVAM